MFKETLPLSPPVRVNARIYGLSNCDQVRKARAWFAEHGVDAVFHDFRKAGLERAMLDRWLRHLPWDALLNRRGTTWRTLAEVQRVSVVDAASAVDLMMAHPSLVRRPVVEVDDRIVVGFHPELYLRSAASTAADAEPAQ